MSIENPGWKIGPSGKPQTMKEWLAESEAQTAQFKQKEGGVAPEETRLEEQG